MEWKSESSDYTYPSGQSNASLSAVKPMSLLTPENLHFVSTSGYPLSSDPSNQHNPAESNQSHMYDMMSPSHSGNPTNQQGQLHIQSNFGGDASSHDPRSENDIQMNLYKRKYDVVNDSSNNPISSNQQSFEGQNTDVSSKHPKIMKLQNQSNLIQHKPMNSMPINLPPDSGSSTMMGNGPHMYVHDDSPPDRNHVEDYNPLSDPRVRLIKVIKIIILYIMIM